MNELQIMVTVGDHPNVISLIGACTKDGEYRLKSKFALPCLEVQRVLKLPG